MTSSDNVKSFHEYFVNEVTKLNTKSIVKNAIDMKQLQCTGYIVYMCDNGECMNITDYSDVNKCFDCNMILCNSCLINRKQCGICGLRQCQQKACTKTTTFVSHHIHKEYYYCKRCYDYIYTTKMK